MGKYDEALSVFGKLIGDYPESAIVPVLHSSRLIQTNFPPGLPVCTAKPTFDANRRPAGADQLMPKEAGVLCEIYARANRLRKVHMQYK